MSWYAKGMDDNQFTPTPPVVSPTNLPNNPVTATPPPPPGGQASLGSPGPVTDPQVSVAPQPVEPIVQPPVQPQTPVQPTPAAKKEFAAPPLPQPNVSVDEAKVHSTLESDKVAKAEGDEYWENYAREIELEKEIAEMGGVEKVEAGEVKVPENLAKEMGIKPFVEVQTPMAQVVSDFKVSGVSLADDQISQGAVKPTSSGFRWLVEWFIYELLKAHFVVKFVKGKFGRSKTS